MIPRRDDILDTYAAGQRVRVDTVVRSVSATYVIAKIVAGYRAGEWFSAEWVGGALSKNCAMAAYYAPLWRAVEGAVGRDEKAQHYDRTGESLF